MHLTMCITHAGTHGFRIDITLHYVYVAHYKYGLQTNESCIMKLNLTKLGDIKLCGRRWQFEYLLWGRYTKTVGQLNLLRFKDCIIVNDVMIIRWYKRFIDLLACMWVTWPYIGWILHHSTKNVLDFLLFLTRYSI